MAVPKNGDDFADDPSILPDALLLRRIAPWQLTPKDAERPNSDAFSNHPDGSGTSVDILEEGWSPERTLAGHDEFGLVSISAGDVRSAGLGVVRAPKPELPQHAYIQGRKTKSRQRRLARSCAWLKRPPE